MVANFQINPDAVFDEQAVRESLGLSTRAVAAACRAGELRCNEVAGRRWFRGQWLIDWIAPAEADREVPAHA